jgi:hypothetical protein
MGVARGIRESPVAEDAREFRWGPMLPKRRPARPQTSASADEYLHNFNIALVDTLFRYT